MLAVPDYLGTCSVPKRSEDTRLNSSHPSISYAVFCLKKKRISRMTARQAITDLVNEGLFYREQGKGTFVSQRKITQQLIRLTGFTEDIKARGQKPGTKVLSAQMFPADETTAEKLRIDPGTLIFRLQRLRLADDEPLAIELSQITFKDC